MRTVYDIFQAALIVSMMAVGAGTLLWREISCTRQSMTHAASVQAPLTQALQAAR